MSTAEQSARDPGSETDVHIEDAQSIARWSRALGTTDEALQRAVQAVGTRVDRIKDYLGAGGMAGDQEDA
jgi:ribosomal protein S11